MNHPSIPAADRAVYVACAGLEKALSALAALRRAIPGTLPIAAAEAHMDDIETDLDNLARKFTAALKVTNVEVERIQEAEEVEYVRTNGLLALAESRLVDRDFIRWTHTLSKPIAPPANDDRPTIERSAAP